MEQLYITFNNIISLEPLEKLKHLIKSLSPLRILIHLEVLKYSIEENDSGYVRPYKDLRELKKLRKIIQYPYFGQEYLFISYKGLSCNSLKKYVDVMMSYDDEISQEDYISIIRENSGTLKFEILWKTINS